MTFDGFISYSHSGDGLLAPAIQRGLAQFAKPWYRTRALRVFLDDASLSANPDLWSGIATALDESEWFILLASPEAARSEWVGKEITHWLTNKSISRILPVVTDGEWEWDPTNACFDPGHSNAVPKALGAVLQSEPRHVDLRWARTEEDLDLRNSRFRAAIADLAAPLHGIAKDELEGEDVRQYRRTRRIARLAVTTLTLLLLVAIVAGGFAFLQRNEARHQARVAKSGQLAALASAKSGTQLDLALLLAVEGHHLENSLDTRVGLVTALQASPALVGFRHDFGNQVSIAAPSPDRQLLAVGNEDGTIRIWDRARSRPTTPSIQAHALAVKALEFSHDGQLLASGSFDGTVRVWRSRSGKPLGKALVGDSAGVYAVTFSEDGSQLVATGWNGTLRRWDVASGASLGPPLDFPVLAGTSGSATRGVRFVPGTRLLAVAVSNGTVRFVDTATGTVTDRAIDVRPARPAGLAATPDGKLLAVAVTSEVRLFDLETLLPLRTLTGHFAAITSLELNADGSLVVAAGDDGRVIVWRTESGEQVQASFTGHRGSVWSAWFAAGDKVESMSDTELATWTLGSRPMLGSRAFADSATTNPLGAGVGVAPIGGSKIAIAGRDASIHIRRANGRQIEAVKLDADVGGGFASSRDERVLAFAVADDVVRGGTHALGNPQLIIWSLEANQVVVQVALKSFGLATAFSPDGQRVAVAELSGEVETLDAHTGKAVVEPMIADRQGATNAVVYSSDGRFIVTGGFDAQAWLWDADSGERLDRFGPPRSGSITALASDPNSARIAASGADGQVVIVDTRTRLQIGQPLSVSGIALIRLAYSKDGQSLAAGASDGSVSLWDVAHRLPIGRPLQGHSGLVTGVAFADRDGVLATGDVDGIVVFRPLDEENWTRRACDLAGRALTHREWTELVGDRAYDQACERSAVRGSVLDAPEQIFVPLPGFRYGASLDAATLLRRGAFAGREVVAEGEVFAVTLVAPTCAPPSPCASTSAPMEPTLVAGERVYTYREANGDEAVAWRPSPFDPDPFLVVVSGPSRPTAQRILKLLIKARP